MNRIHTTVAILSLCVLILGWQVSRTDGAPAIDTQPIAQPLSTQADSEAKPADPAGPIETEKRQSGGLPSQETEVVLGFRVRKDRDCEVQIRYVTDPESGETSEAMTCEPRTPELPHPYESWSNETLAQEAFGDAKAAEILALRHIGSENAEDEVIGLNLLYRAVALSGDPDVFNKAISLRYANIAQNGEPNLKNLKQLLVFSHISGRFGHEAIDADMITADLKRYGVPEADIRELHLTSDRILRQMARLQTEITGSTSIQEVLADA